MSPVRFDRTRRRCVERDCARGGAGAARLPVGSVVGGHGRVVRVDGQRPHRLQRPPGLHPPPLSLIHS
eukprot:2839264-Rhodomonas_salina.1